jgi:hypothetical protein
MLQKGLPPDLLIVLDRSGSMGDAPPAGGGTKWDQMTAAIDTTVMTLQGQIKWGLEMFPSDDSCGVSASVDVPVASMNAAAISSAIGGKMPNGSTPTADAIHMAASYLSAVTDSNPKYILLATDGEPNCAAATSPTSCTCPPGTMMMNGQCCLPILGCIPCPTSGAGGPDDAGAEQAVSDAAAMGIDTFVVGIATDSSADAVLNQMAQNGKTARPGMTQYYPVGSQADLVATVNTIAGQIISCSFPLATPPAHPEDVSVDVGAQTVPRDPAHANGWDFGPGQMSIQFYGSFCTMLQSGAINSVEAVYGCGPVS